MCPFILFKKYPKNKKNGTLFISKTNLTVLVQVNHFFQFDTLSLIIFSSLSNSSLYDLIKNETPDKDEFIKNTLF